MSVKTLNGIHGIALPAKTASAPRTYSIAPAPAFVSDVESRSSAEIDSFLEAENPMGCIRGVMWVMAFNIAVFLLGFMIWQSCKILL